MAHRHIELVFDALTNPNNLEMMRGVLQAAAEQGGSCCGEHGAGEREFTALGE